MKLHLTDQQLIDRVRWNQRHRRKIGAVLFIVGVLLFLLLSYFINDIHQKHKAILDALAVSQDASLQQTIVARGEWSHIMGFSFGFMCAGGLISAGMFVVMGVVLSSTNINRKDILLLKCWDERAEKMRVGL